ncbi:hypothetical protein IAD21_04312 [Abditibacteriota bacterium]|nr:hypothetical protein IAD21_04312 [Abditibacteriota bacterium]
MTLHSLLYPRRDDEIDILEAYQAHPLNRNAFANEGSRRCPKCGEDCPADSRMCWSCFCPLPDENHQPGTGREWAKREWEKLNREVKRRERIDNAKYASRMGLFICALSAIMFSGYLPDYNIALIGSGWALIIVAVGWFKWDEHVAARQAAAQGEPITRILDTILLYAGRDGASQIRLRAGVDAQVHYFIEDTWHEQMRIPGYVWEPLRSLLSEKTADWKSPLVYAMHEKSFELWPEFKRDNEYPLETVLLTLHRTI